MSTAVTASDDAILGAERYTVKLPAFEGPLDLLLFLVRKHEVDLYDIPIHAITRQYLDILRAMQQLKLDIAGEFFVMAATLMQIKSAMLLPKDEQLPQPDEDDEGHDPRWELIEQLLEYQRFKETAATLQEHIAQARDYLPRHYAAKDADALVQPLEPSDKIELWNTFNTVLRRLAEELIGAGEIHDESVSVAGRMEHILERLRTQTTFTFSSLMQPGEGLTHLVATFLAILELTRLKTIALSQDRAFTDIHIDALDAPGESPSASTSEFDTPETGE